MARTSLPPGFRFSPTDVELVMFYLKRKVMGKDLRTDVISDFNIYKCSPWDLPEKSCLRSKDLEWYFFCPKERKYANGARANRTTEIGYWKATGRDKSVLYKEQTVGMRKTLVFHTGHAPKGERTNWVMYEYRLQNKDLANAGVTQDAYVLCKVFQKSGPGPKVGAHYGAPYNEEDWEDDLELRDESTPATSQSLPALAQNMNDSAITSTFLLGSIHNGPSSEAGTSNILSLAEEVPPPISDTNENILSLLDMFTEDGTSFADHNGNNEVENNNEGLPRLDGNEIYNGLEDLDNWAELRDDRLNLFSRQTTEYDMDHLHVGQDVPFLELNDLNDPLNYPTETIGSEDFLGDRLPETCENNYLQQNCFPITCFDASQHVSIANQLIVQSERSDVIVNHPDMLPENIVPESANPEFCATWYADCDQLNVRTRSAVQEQNRGEHQRISYSRLQHLLESIPACPASANGFKRTKGSSLLIANDGSSINNVKAEVTCGDGCTKDALSEMLGESLCQCGQREEVKCSSGLMFFFCVVSALVWLFLVALFVGFGPFFWMKLCFCCTFSYLCCVNKDILLHFLLLKLV